jgi:hypothetical protein
MATLDEVRAAKPKFHEQFDFASVGIGKDNGGFRLEVRVKNKSEANQIPKTFEGVEVHTVTIGKISPR